MSYRPLEGKLITLGVCASISAYKSPIIVRQLIKLGAKVRVVMTKNAQNFIGKLTLSDLSGSEVVDYGFSNSDSSPHTRLAKESDLIVVAPASLRLIGSYANAIASDVLVSTLLAYNKPILICPAMHAEMWENPINQKNVSYLKSLGVKFVGPESGMLANGDVGLGRLAEPTTIVDEIQRSLLSNDSYLKGKKVVVSAGGTKEPIDPVRYLTNRSSGKQGHAIATCAYMRGAEVYLVTTSQLSCPDGIKRVQVETAQQMRNAILELATDADLLVMAAAVSDFRPSTYFANKIKKDAQVPVITFEKNPDILDEVARLKHEGKLNKDLFIVGFSAETENLLENATKKLALKNINAIVANDVAASNVGFDYDTNEVTIILPSGQTERLRLTSKLDIADQLLKFIEKQLCSDKQ